MKPTYIPRTPRPAPRAELPPLTWPAPLDARSAGDQVATCRANPTQPAPVGMS
jgi:hypothetical protein